MMETDLRLSRDELVEQGKYFNVPASELIFLTHGEHSRLHNDVRFEDPNERKKCGLSGENNPMWGKSPSEETRKRQSEVMKRRYEDPKARQKTSEALNRPEGKVKICDRNKNRRWMNNGINSVFLKTQEEIEHYRELGYIFGRIYRRK